ncbi:SRPBCC family protein [Mycobacterium sp. NPDC050853]|uniref:SRPBCC family protein n=1 Tax=Mycobacteriaceae TaxID=1762 RepID=UPI0015DDEA30|nr:SRPBCC family protein [Mycobacteroides sp. LB1]
METVTVQRTIAAPRQAVFDWISNAHNYTRIRGIFHEHVAEPGETARYGLGAVRMLVGVFGVFWERITAYTPPEVFDYHVYRVFPPARHENGRVSFAEVDGGTHVVWTSSFELRVPLLGAFLTRAIARPLFTYVFNRALDLATDDLTRRPRQRA